MAYEGQPFPSTTYSSRRAKISDGESVRVTVPENTTIEAQKFYLIGGFFGVAMQDVTTGAGETAEVILTIEEAELKQTKRTPRKITLSARRSFGTNQQTRLRKRQQGIALLVL